MAQCGRLWQNTALSTTAAQLLAKMMSHTMQQQQQQQHPSISSFSLVCRRRRRRWRGGHRGLGASEPEGNGGCPNTQLRLWLQSRVLTGVAMIVSRIVALNHASSHTILPQHAHKPLD